MRFVLAPMAEHDIVEILTWTHEHFGEQARHRYETLIIQAIEDLAENPERAGTSERAEIVDGAKTYHMLHSRDRVPRSMGRVRNPRHLILYRVIDDALEIARVLHDSLDLARHLPADYRANGPD